jgi:REP element-mobilizing transposase RayT
MQLRSHAKDLRKGRVSQSGQIYLVSAVTRNRVPVFASFDAARCLVAALRTEASAGRADTLAFVVMPDHLHWLLALTDKATLSAVVQTVKSVVAHQLGGQIWQPGFHDRALRREEDLADVARYVVANPVRAGLVRRVGEYSHWDAVWV